MRNKEQELAKKKLKKNFFEEAMLKEINLEHKRQLSENVKRGIKRKKFSTC